MGRKHVQQRLLAVVGLVLWSGAVPCRAETHAAVGSRVELNEPINARYPGSNGAATLADGVTGTLNYGKEYLGFEGPDIEITVVLPVATAVHVLAADFLQVTAPAIFLPLSVDFAVSENGRNFRTVATVRPKADEKAEGPLVERLQVDGLDLTVAAVRVRATNGGKVPSWHRSPQAERWTFVSEVLVNPGQAPVSAADLLKTYTVGANRWPLTRLEDLLRQGNAEQRRRVCRDLAALVGAAEVTVDAQRFCLEQLARFGEAGDVPAVVKALTVPELQPTACRALAHLGGPDAESALVTAASQGAAPARGAALAALAAMRSPRVVELASALGDEALGQVAAGALAAAATPAALQALTAALPKASEGARPALVEALLAGAGEALSKGLREPALAAYATVEQTAAATPAQRLAAVAGQVRAGRTERLAEVFEAAVGPDAAVVRSALSLGADLVAEQGPAALQAAFAELPANARAAAVQAVGRRAKPADVPWLLGQLAATDADVRLAAAGALSSAGGVTAVAPLIRVLESTSAPERTAAVEALSCLAGDGVDRAVLQGAASATGEARKALCAVLESRRPKGAAEVLLAWTADANAEIRRSAWKALPSLVDQPPLAALLTAFAALPADAAGEAEKALLAGARAPAATEGAAAALGHALDGAPSVAHRVVLEGVLGEVGGPEAERLLVAGLRHDAAEVRAAAIRALAGWGNAAPCAALLTACAGEKDERLATLGLRSALELLRRGGAALPGEAASALLTQAAALPRRDEERALLLETASVVPCAAALDIVAAATATPALRPGAEAALLKLAPALWPEAPLAVQAALTQTAEKSPTPATRTLAAELLARLPPAAALKRLEATPWTPWFDGKTLNGWRIVNGKADAWVVRDGLLVAQAGGGGWLAAATEYADYLAELEFRLPPDGNSGFFLRPPLEGNPAWEGIEVQILDDAAPQYANLRPDQYCASIYGMAAANPRVSRPAGEWQRLCVLCLGRRVAVWLNGVAVAEADLDQHLAQADKIRGLKRTAGFPGLQNEHGPIEFRNLRLKNLAP